MYLRELYIISSHKDESTKYPTQLTQVKSAYLCVILIAMPYCNQSFEYYRTTFEMRSMTVDLVIDRGEGT